MILNIVIIYLKIIKLAPKLKYQKTLKADPVLQKYRSRYQAVQRLARENPEKHQTLYEYYKVEGKKMKSKYLSKVITAKEFEDWIDTTKRTKRRSRSLFSPI